VHGLAHVGHAAAGGVGPEDLDQLVGGDDAVAVGDEVLEDVARLVSEPLAGERALAALHPAAPEREDAQLRAAHPVRLGAPAAVARDARPDLQHDGGLGPAVRRARHPDGVDGAVLERQVEAQLRQRPLVGEGELGDAVVGQRRSGPAAVEEVAAADALALEQRPEHGLGAQVRPLHVAPRVGDHDPGREELENRAVGDRRLESEL
jgi:hypothetical protein